MLIITADDGTETPVTVVPVEPTKTMKEAAFGPILEGGRGGPVSSDYIRQQVALSNQAKVQAAADPSLVSAVIEMRRACEAAAKTFRWYEELHTAKGPEHADKAARNRVEAEKLEAALSRIREATDAG